MSVMNKTKLIYNTLWGLEECKTAKGIDTINMSEDWHGLSIRLLCYSSNVNAHKQNTFELERERERREKKEFIQRPV